MNKVFVLQHLRRKFALHFDKIADDIVIFDFEIGYPGGFGILVLQLDNHLMAVVFKQLYFIQRRIKTFTDKTAVTCQKRQILSQSLFQR